MGEIVKFELPTGASLLLEEGDITKQQVDAIVNAANSSLMGGGGVDGAIHRAGGPAILAECKKIVAEKGHLPPGDAVATTGGNLKAAFVIHTVGPIYRDGISGESGLLASCYRESLRLADRLHLESIAFPSISTGAYRFPIKDAAAIAFRTLMEELRDARHVREARFVLFGQHDFTIYEEAGRKYVSAREGVAKIHKLRLDTTLEKD